MRKLLVFLSLVCSVFVHSQQLNCTVTVNAQKLANINPQIFTNLQSALTDLVNKTDWNGQLLNQNERIN